MKTILFVSMLVLTNFYYIGTVSAGSTPKDAVNNFIKATQEDKFEKQ